MMGLVRVANRPHQHLTVTTKDGETFDLGFQVEGTDPVARFHQWRQHRKVVAYCNNRLRTLTGDDRTFFVEAMEARRG